MMSHDVEIFPTERQKLYEKLADNLEVAFYLNRKVVSFQANKVEPISRWFKYKEGFSSKLVKYFLTKFSNKTGKVLDPFAGIGTTLFAAQELGWESYGIEILPVGVYVTQTREALNSVDINELKEIISNLWSELKSLQNFKNHIHHISITQDAFPGDTEVVLNQYLTFCDNIKNKQIQTILKFAAFSILEEISFTRKDGQYLRWDHRSNRELLGKPFDKGKIPTFEEAIKHKLSTIVTDLSSFNNSLFNLYKSKEKEYKQYPVNIIQGSCLEELPKLQNNFFDFIITSPPYCNRYDYTRTYALELVFLGYDNEKIRTLRQEMLSCTVENKDKVDYLNKLYSFLSQQDTFDKIVNVYNSSSVMTEVNTVLDTLNKHGKLNNNNIPRMVKNYFLELCFVIYEMARVMKRGGYCVMVNDNVRYGGEEIPVDLILSEFAENFGLSIIKIYVLPKGKGNSSQQMGNYGRTEVRKCVYLWQKK